MSAEILQISQQNKAVINQHEEMKRNYELRQKAEKFVVPTNDLVVKARLR